MGGPPFFYPSPPLRRHPSPKREGKGGGGELTHWASAQRRRTALGGETPCNHRDTPTHRAHHQYRQGTRARRFVGATRCGRPGGGGNRYGDLPTRSPADRRDVIAPDSRQPRRV